MAPPKKKLAGAAAAAAAAKAGQGNPPPAAAAAIAVKPELIAGSIFQRFPFQVVPKRDVKGRDCKAAKAKSRNSLPSKDPSSSQPPTKVVRLPVTYRSLPLVRLSRRWPAFHLASTPGLGAQSGSLLDRVDNCLHLVFFPGEYQDFTSFAHQVRRAERHKTEKALPFPVGHVPVLQGLVRANYLNRNSGSSSTSKNKSVKEAPPLPRELALFTANGPMVVKIRTLEEVGGKGHPAYQHYDESDDAKMLHLCLVPRESTVKKSSSSSSSSSSESSSETSSIASNSQANGGNGGAEPPRLLADWEEDHRAEREPGIEDLIRGNQQQNAVIFGHMRHNMMQHFAHRLRRGAGGVFVGGGGPGAARAGGAGGAEPPRRAPPALPLLPLAREERLFERPNVRRVQLPDMPRPPPPPPPQLQMVIQGYPAPAPAPAPAAAPAAAPAPAPAPDAPPPPPRPLPPGLNGLHPQELNRQRLLELNLRSRPLLRRNSRGGGQVAPAAAAPTAPPPPQQNVNSG
ncbi:hypothetical protein TYRP_020323 [Tyrophagus putrescentiae]|nr:hypothetical protein TYRP_020323 [Tyrophagus putrescentiae]